MKKQVNHRRLPWAVALLLLGGAAESAEWTVGDALKQIDKATKGLRGLTGDVMVTDQQTGTQAATIEAKASIRTDGSMRLDAADGSKTILCTPSKMFVHLAQYALVGFAPRGSQLKKDFLLTVVEADGTLDDKSIVLLELTPKAEKLRAAVSKIHLWVDQANWLPAQQRIFHGGAETHITVSYSNLSRNDKLDNKLFAPKWPKGTRSQKP